MAEAVLLVTKRGYAKVVEAEEFPTRGRGTRGVTAFKLSEETGPVVSAEHVQTGRGQRVLVVTAQGMALMTSVDDLQTRKRTSGGVRLMAVAEDDKVVSVLV
jgi:DNA gyrase subunit A